MNIRAIINGAFCFTLALILSSIFLTNTVSAETKTFIRDHTYQASEYESKADCSTLALAQLKMILLEELGTYLESETEIKDFQLTKDRITAYTAGIVRTKVLDENWDGKRYWLKAKIEVDPDDVTKRVNRLRNDIQKTKELEVLKRQRDENLIETEKLRKELVISKSDNAKIAQYKEKIMEIEANALMNEAIALSNYDNKLKEAIDTSTRAIQLYSKRDYKAFAYGTRGTFFYRLSDYDKAIKDYTTAIELNPKDALFYGLRGLAYGRLGKFDLSIKDYNNAIELEPTASDFYNRGLGYMQFGNNEQAVQDFTMAINLNPKYKEAYMGRGGAYGRMRKHEKALMDMNTAINIDPQYADSYYNRGIAYAQLGEEARAIEDYDKAIRLNIKKEDYHIARGAAYGRLGKHQQSLIDFNTAITLNPQNSFTYMARGIAYTFLSNFHKAIADFNRAIKLDSEVYEMYNFRGFSYLKLDNHDQAIRDFTKAIKLNPKYIDAYKNRSIAYQKIGNRTQAESDNQTVKSLEQQRAIEYETLKLKEMMQEAEALSRKSNFEEAIKLCTQAIAFSPNNADAFIQRGYNYGRLGNYKMAKADYTQAIRLVPNNSYAYSFRGQILIMEGDKFGALDDFTKSCELGDNEACNKVYELNKELPINKRKTNISERNETAGSTSADQHGIKGIKGIELIDGNVIEGQIISMDPDIVKIRTKDGKVLSYSVKNEVQSFIKE